MFWWKSRERREQDLARELSSHLELEAEEQQESGVTPEEASYAAQRAFGNVTALKEDVRRAWGWTSAEQLGRDFLYSIRILRHSPGFVTAAVLSLALGIGANTAIFTVVNAVLLRPLPFPEPERLVQIWESRPDRGYFENVVNPVNFLDWRDRTRSFEGMSAIATEKANLTGAGDPIAVPAMGVSPAFFAVLGIHPSLGRGFRPQEGVPGREHVLVLSFRLWQSRFGGDPQIVGRKLIVDGEASTIVGVMPRAFSLPKNQADIWLPLPITRSKEWQGGRFLQVIGQLKRGVTLKQAQQDLQRVARQLEIERPDADKGWSAEAVPMLTDATSKVRLPLIVLLAAVGLVLLIACANVANLSLMRATGRLHEISVRATLGASRARLMQQLLSESVVLVSAALALGLVLGNGGVKALLALVQDESQLPRLSTIHMDGRVLFFAIGISLVSTVLFGLIPSVQVSQVDPHVTLRLTSNRVTGRNTLRKALVVAEVALSLVLLAGAALMLRSFQRLISINPGFDTQHILTMGMLTSPARYADTEKRATYFGNILREVRNVPGVEDAGSIHFLPMQERTSGSCFSFPGQRADASNSPDAEYLVISPGYFETLKTPILSGRSFSVRDQIGRPSVILVNAAFARKFLAHVNPVGQKLNLCWTARSPAEIVGVVQDARQTELKREPKPTIFINNLQAPMYFAQLVIRTSGDPAEMARSAVAAIHRVDPDQALTDIQTMDKVVFDSVAQPRLQLVLLVTFAGMAGLLATIGVYGVVSYSVAQRTREIGIRMALGAQASDVRGDVLGEALFLAAVGVTIGIFGALLLTRVLTTMLFETDSRDPLTFACVAATALVTVVLASIIPAQRAAHTDPLVSLRYE